MATADGTNKYYFVADEGDTAKINELNALIRMDDASVWNSLSEGVYTWAIITAPDEPPQLYLLKVLSLIEVGTSHSWIIIKLKSQFGGKATPLILHYAGEMYVSKPGKNKRKRDYDETIERDSSPSVVFNFSSGTYMKDRDIQVDTASNEVIQFIASKVGLPKIEYTGQDDTTLITPETVRMTKKDLKLLVGCGAVIYEYNSSDDCAKSIKAMKQNEVARRRYTGALQMYERTRLKYPNTVAPNPPVYIDENTAVQLSQEGGGRSRGRSRGRGKSRGRGRTTKRRPARGRKRQTKRK